MITSQATIRPLIENALQIYASQGIEGLVQCIHQDILQQKVRFPILEYAAAQLYDALSHKEQLVFTDRIIALDEIGSYTIAGMMLQLRLDRHYDQSIKKAMEYIITGDKWYVCDIIGERVQGHALLTWPDRTIEVLRAHASHADKWIVRAIGVATHYAVKNGLRKAHADEMFLLLCSLAHTTEEHTRKGVGWGAKTIAKFHPEIIERHRALINEERVRPWFHTKIKIGLGRTSKYAGRYTS